MSPRRNAITVLVIAAAIAGCRANRTRTPDDTIVMLFDGPITTADPRFAKNNYDSKLSRLVAPGLITVDTPDAAPQLELAEKIERIDDLTVDVLVRADAKFSDGKPVRAEDVARTFNSVMDDKCKSLYQGNLLERFASIEAIDDKRVRFRFKKKLATFMTDIEFGVVSFHDSPPGECRGKRIIGAGPFSLRSVSTSSAYLDRNEYYRTPPKIAHIDIRVVRDPAARILMLVGGSADLVQNGVRPDLVDEVIGRPRVQQQSGASVILTYMLINNTDPVLQDHRVREALALEIDRDAIIGAEFGGRAVLATGLLPPNHWAYNPDVPHYTHDVARANQLLDEAGFKRDARGIRRDAKGEPFGLVYKTSADPFRVLVARIIASQLREVGIPVEIRSFEFSTFFADVKGGNYQIATMQSTEITEPDFYMTFFHSTRWPTKKDPDGYNRWRYKNPKVDQLVEDGRAELDLDRRKAIYNEVQKIVAEDLPIIPLWHEDNVVLSNVTVQGYEIVPDARFRGLVSASKSL
jgi:peptide/nickel transport system substrate-binding protein